ncbi:hypothetical protein EVAR_30383_1 [Eumeta japonica]|uniref:Uncharacterized protein n=1 Tax=Eumeta variegata TaxID=151549 RepID=A0A4C1W7V9_EUMVA|nr:hypothetical protein EVAR_30383_1 [Eumeta japonica]
MRREKQPQNTRRPLLSIRLGSSSPRRRADEARGSGSVVECVAIEPACTADADRARIRLRVFSSHRAVPYAACVAEYVKPPAPDGAVASMASSTRDDGMRVATFASRRGSLRHRVTEAIALGRLSRRGPGGRAGTRFE